MKRSKRIRIFPMKKEETRIPLYGEISAGLSMSLLVKSKSMKCTKLRENLIMIQVLVKTKDYGLIL